MAILKGHYNFPICQMFTQILFVYLTCFSSPNIITFGLFSPLTTCKSYVLKKALSHIIGGILIGTTDKGLPLKI